MSLRSKIDLYKRYINVLNSKSKQLTNYKADIENTLYDLNSHDYSEDEFQGKNYNDYVLNIQDLYKKIQSSVFEGYDDNMICIRKRIRYLEDEIDYMEELLARESEDN